VVLQKGGLSEAYETTQEERLSGLAPTTWLCLARRSYHERETGYQSM
jgi:hypothetical protein